MRAPIRRLLALSTLGLVVALGTPFAHAQATFQFDMPAQPLADALREIARQTGANILFDSSSVKDITAPALRAELTTDEAIARVLTGTKLEVLRTTPTAMVVQPAAPTIAKPQAAAAARTYGAELAPIHLAQNDQSIRNTESKGNQAPARNTSSLNDRDKTPTALSEIVVTGTNIRGAGVAGSNIIVIDREYIDKSGYVAVKDILDTLPQNFSGGVTENLGTTDVRAFNTNSGSAVNLRGLGASATLVLINGRRPVPGGFAGAFVDVSNIPSSAIERIEVLPDGASAIYGSDAIGGVVNIILRRDYKGAETRGRFGTLDGDADEFQVSQLFGTNWSGGNALVGYQYYERESLLFTERSFSVDTDQRSRGGDNFSSVNSNPGNFFDPSTFEPALAIPAGQDGTALTVADLLPGVVNVHNQAEQNDLLPQQEMHSAFFSLSQDVGERSQLFAEGRYNVRDVTSRGGGTGLTLFVPSSNPYFVDPFDAGFVILGYNFLDDFGPSVTRGESESYSSVLGVTFDFGQTWQLTTTGSYAEEKNQSAISGIDFTALDVALADPNPATAFNPFGDGSNTNPATLEAIDITNHIRAVTDLWEVHTKADGHLFALPGGVARLAVGADYREEGFDPLEAQDAGNDRRVSALFAELALPIVQRVDVSLAGRYEDYSDFGNTFNPKLGVTWTPVESLKFRGSWGTSFKAPRLVDLHVTPTTNPVVLLPVADPQSPSGSSFALIRFGRNQDLREETATTWTVGLDFTPVSMPGMDLSLTYYDIDYEGRVVRPGPFQLTNILLEEERWSEVITRNPSQEEVSALCNSREFVQPPFLCTLLPPAAIIDVRLRNIAATRTQGLDLEMRQTLETAYGVFNLGVTGSYIFSFQETASRTSPSVDIVNTLFNPVALRVRGLVSWNRGAWSVNTSLNHTDGYKDTSVQPSRTIDSWTTLDFHVSYRVNSSDEWLDNLEFALGAVNVLDKDPPFANLATGFDATNANPYGRLLSLYVTKGW